MSSMPACRWILAVTTVFVVIGAVPAYCSDGSGSVTSAPSTLNEDQIAERGARMARRDDREYREYLREEQRSQPGCPARKALDKWRG